MPRKVQTRFEMLSVPPASEWKPFSEAIKYRQGPARHNSPVNVEIDIVGNNSPYFRVNEDLVNKLIFDPVFGIDAPLTIKIGSYKNLSVTQVSVKDGSISYIIYLFMYQTPENANYVFIHELQHIYQNMEKRLQDDRQPKRTEHTDWHEAQKEYQQKERELDANAMAQKLVESGIQFIEPQTEEYLNSIPEKEQAMTRHNMEFMQKGDPNRPGKFPPSNYWSEVGQQAVKTLGI